MPEHSRWTHSQNQVQIDFFSISTDLAGCSLPVHARERRTGTGAGRRSSAASTTRACRRDAIAFVVRAILGGWACRVAVPASVVLPRFRRRSGSVGGF